MSLTTRGTTSLGDCMSGADVFNFTLGSVLEGGAETKKLPGVGLGLGWLNVVS